MTLSINTAIASAAIALAALPAAAGLPNAHTWPMEHIMVHMHGTSLEAHVGADANNPILMQRFEGEMYDGAASALNGQYYSDQYGWILDGIVDPGAGNSIWIQLLNQSDGLSTYEGGRRMMIDAQTFDPIFGTNGSDMAWQWSGMMTHNWYAASELGDYQATYRIYIGDDTGAQVDGFDAGEVTLHFRAVPAPGALALMGMGGLALSRRKRG